MATAADVSHLISTIEEGEYPTFARQLQRRLARQPDSVQWQIFNELTSLLDEASAEDTIQARGRMRLDAYERINTRVAALRLDAVLETRLVPAPDEVFPFCFVITDSEYPDLARELFGRVADQPACIVLETFSELCWRLDYALSGSTGEKQRKRRVSAYQAVNKIVDRFFERQEELDSSHSPS